LMRLTPLRRNPSLREMRKRHLDLFKQKSNEAPALDK
jgi:hypothetical protein